MDNYKLTLFHQTPLKILSFLSLRPNEILCERDIADVTKSSIGATNQTLRLLLELDIINRTKKGNVFLYKLNPDNPILRHFKIYENLLDICDLVKKIKPYSYEIILYGSCAAGLNTVDSDVDLFIKTEYTSKVKKIVNEYRARDERLKAVILDPLEIAASRKTDEVFYKEVRKGIPLWEGRPTYEEI